MVDRIVGDPDENTVARWRRERDELLDRIDSEGLIPDWCWPRLTGVLAKMDEQAETFAWLPVRFLQDVVQRGVEVFNSDRAFDQRRLFGDNDRPSLVCSCGNSTAPAAPSRAAHGRRYLVGVCDDHGEVVEWERRPPPEQTL